MTPLCSLDELGLARGFQQDGLLFFVVRRGEGAVAYLNRCPHLGIPLEWAPDTFLAADGRHIQCSTHGARFDIETGEGLSGPCLGDWLVPVTVEVRDGMVFLKR